MSQPRVSSERPCRGLTGRGLPSRIRCVIHSLARTFQYIKMSNSTNAISVKVSFGEDLRRFNLPLDVSFEQLMNTVRSLYSRSVPYHTFEGFVLKYKDDEGDLITVPLAIPAPCLLLP